MKLSRREHERADAYAASSFGAYLTLLRTIRGMTQGQLAEKAGMNHTHLCKIEHDNTSSPPSIQTLRKLAQALQVDTASFLFRAGKVPTGFDPDLVRENPAFCELLWILTERPLPQHCYQHMLAFLHHEYSSSS